MTNNGRTSKGTFAKGVSGNPDGRPPRKFLTKELTAAIDGPTRKILIAKIIGYAKAGERWAMELIFDRIEGKVPTSLGIDVPEDFVFTLEFNKNGREKEDG